MHKYRENHGDDSVYCKCGKGNNPPNNYIFMRIREGEVCVATSFLKGGQDYFSSTVDIEKMRECPHNSNKNNSK